MVVHVPRRDRAPARAVPLPDSGLPRQRAVTGRPGHEHSVQANAKILEGFVDALNLQDITLVVHDVVLRIDPMMAKVERSLQITLAGLPVLTLFGRKNDRYGWQDRFQQIFPHATAAGIKNGHHFPFNDDPDAYSAAISTWWAEKVAAADGKFTNSSQESIR